MTGSGRRKKVRNYHRVRRIMAFILCFLMVITNVQSHMMISWAAETTAVKFLLDGYDIRRAAQQAVEEGSIVTGLEESFTDREGEPLKVYKELFASNTVYSFLPEIFNTEEEEIPDGAELQAYLLVKNDDPKYELDGNETVIFLFINGSEENLKFAVDINGVSSEFVNVKSYQSIFGGENSILPVLPAGNAAGGTELPSGEISSEESSPALEEETSVSVEESTIAPEESVAASEENTTVADESQTMTEEESTAAFEESQTTPEEGSTAEQEESQTTPEEGSTAEQEESQATPEKDGTAVSEESQFTPEEGSTAASEESQTTLEEESTVEQEESLTTSEEGSTAVEAENTTALETENVKVPEESKVTEDIDVLAKEENLTIARNVTPLLTASVSTPSVPNVTEDDKARESKGDIKGKIYPFAIMDEAVVRAYSVKLKELAPLTLETAENCIVIQRAGGFTESYETLVDAAKAAVDGDVLRVNGRVVWGGYDSDDWCDGDIIVRGAEGASLVLNGAYGNGKYGEGDHISTLGCGMTFDNLEIETTASMNYIVANGNRLEITDSVYFNYNGSATSGEIIKSDHWQGEITVVGGSLGSDGGDVESTEIVLNAGRYTDVIGGSVLNNVNGDTSLTLDGNATAFQVLGGSFCGNVGGSTTVYLENGASTVMGGSYKGDVEGNTDVTVNGRVSLDVFGGSAKGNVKGNVSLTIDEEAEINCATTGGSVQDAALGWMRSSNYDGIIDYDDKDIVVSREDIYVGGDTLVTVNGLCNEAVFGGGRAPVYGNTRVVINGTVDAAPLSDGVYGGGADEYGEVSGDTTVIINEGANIIRKTIHIGGRDKDGIWGGMVVGGGNRSVVNGDSHIILNGKVGSPEFGGLVLGGGFTNSSRYTCEVRGTAYITVNEAPYECTVNLPWRSFDTKNMEGLNSSNGIYGGGFNYAGAGKSDITVNAALGAVPVYGGGLLTNADGAAAITVYGSADTVYGGGKNAGIEAGDVGSSKITVKENGRVGTIYGYEINKTADGQDVRNVKGSAEIIFDGNGTTDNPNRELVQLINADEVSVIDGSHIVLADENDYQQLVRIENLKVADGAELALAANQHIAGDYTGSVQNDNKGVLRIRAGKKLIAGGTASGYTELGIDETEGNPAAMHQVYVAAMQGSQAGIFTWTDPVYRFKLEQNKTLLSDENANLTAGELETLQQQPNENADKWWLVKGDPIEVKKYSVIFRAGSNGKFADGSAEVAIRDIPEGTLWKDIITVPAVTGDNNYSFVNWNDRISGGTGLPAEDTIITRNYVFEAQWKPTGPIEVKKYSVTFRAGSNGKFADGSTEVIIEDIPEGTLWKDVIEVPTITGDVNYSFVNWNNAASGATGLPDGETEITRNYVFEAQWKPAGPIEVKKYSVTFKAGSNGKFADGSAEVIIEDIPEGTLWKDVIEVPTITGDVNYSFVNWNNAASGVTGLPDGETEITRNYVFEAQWKPAEVVSHTIIYKAGDHGTFADGSIEIMINDVPHGSFWRDITDTPSTTGNRNYSFTGWKDDATQAVGLPAEDTRIDRDYVFVAQWRYEGSNDSNGGSSSGGGQNNNTPYVPGGPGDNPITVVPEPVPLAELPTSGTDELVIINDEEVPLAGLPKTGDQHGAAGEFAIIISGILFAAYALFGKKKEKSE